MEHTIYNSFEEYLISCGSSLDELRIQARKSIRPKRTGVQLARLQEEFLISTDDHSVGNIINEAIIWDDTEQGYRYWEIINDGWRLYVRRNNIRRISVYKKVNAFCGLPLLEALDYKTGVKQL